MSPEDQAEEEKKIGATSALGKITNAGYQCLDVSCLALVVPTVIDMLDSSQLIRYFTCGPVEVRAWTIRRGTKAPQAAGVIQ